MLYALARIAETELQLRGCPVRVMYGPERMQDTALTDTRIVFQRSRRARDRISSPSSSKLNPSRRAERELDALVQVIARSSLDGAQLHDHEELADQIVDMLIVVLQIAAARSKTTVALNGGSFLSTQALALEGMESWPGVVYELTFSVQRGVFDRSWAGDAKGTVACDNIVTTGTCVSTTVPED